MGGGSLFLLSLHRLGGYLFLIAGVVILLLCFAVILAIVFLLLFNFYQLLVLFCGFSGSTSLLLIFLVGSTIWTTFRWFYGRL